MLTILAAVFVFGVLVTVHEFGHFITAKMTGMRVDEFAIGFGPKIYQCKDGETVYTLRAIPLGGFNRIAGMDPDDFSEDDADGDADEEFERSKPLKADDPRGFNNKPIPARMLVILAGALMNFFLPIILFTAIFCIKGVDMPLNEPVIGKTVDFMAADNAGLKAGDRILTINGKAVKEWADIQQLLKDNGLNEAAVLVEREGAQKLYKMQPQFNKDYNKPMIGISPKIEHKDIGPVDAIVNAFTYEKFVMTTMVTGLYQLVMGNNSSADLSGPIGVAKMAGEVAQVGILPLLNFTAFLSINLGIINLLPLPALDGGHFILLLLESVRRKPLGANAMQRIQMTGIVMILLLTLFSTFKDLTR